jgi:hypothetical protein
MNKRIKIMKTRHLVFGLVLLILGLGACREINVRTTVNRDGSFTRTITVSGDSADAFKKELPYPVDASWSMTSRKDTSGKGKFIVTYTKNFKNNEELKAETERDTSWFSRLPRHIDIRKRFGFFYSYVEYNEIYQAANPFKLLPYKSFVTADEYLWVTRKHPVQSPSDSVKRKEAEDKVMNYLLESATAEIEKILDTNIQKLNEPGLKAIQIRNYHDRIKRVLSDGKSMDEEMMIDSLKSWSGISVIDRLKEIQPPLFREFNVKIKILENVLTMEEFHVEAGMPGLITGTNSSMLNGNQVSWDVFPMGFLLEDYTMMVESRVINVWAFVLSGIILLGLLLILTMKSLKGNKSKA